MIFLPPVERRFMQKPIKKYQDLEEQMQILKAFFSEYFRKTMSPSGLGRNDDFTLMEVKALSAFLDIENSYTVSELSNNAHIPKSNMTSIITRLQKKKIVIKKRGIEDQRIVRVSLTEKGKDLFYRFMKKRVIEIEALIGQLSSQKQKELFIALEKAANILKSVE